MSKHEHQIIVGSKRGTDVCITRIDNYVKTGIYSVQIERLPEGREAHLPSNPDNTENVDFQGARAAEQSEQVYCALIAAAMLRAVLP